MAHSTAHGAQGAQTARHTRSARLVARRLAPWLLLSILSAATVFVWWQQVRHQRSLLVSHTNDVAFQASRRLEIFMESRLVVAEIFSERWSTHEGRDLSQRRFSQFASVLLSRVRSFKTVWLVRPDGTGVWVAPEDRSSALAPHLRQWNTYGQVRRTRSTTLTRPVRTEDGQTSFAAVFPLHRGLEFLGFLVVELDAEALFSQCFHRRIRDEFGFRIEDAGRLLHGNAPAGVSRGGRPTIAASRRFRIRNRTWRLSVAPLDPTPVSMLSANNLLVLLLGLALSAFVSGLFAWTAKQTQEKRRARKQAREALRGRHEATRALRGSEARYRNVFDFASDGLLVVDNSDIIVDANLAAGRMHGYAPERLIGRQVESLIEPECRGRFRVFLRRLARESSARIELSGVTRQGAPLEIEIKGDLISYGDRTRKLLLVSDLTEHRNAQRRMVHLSRAVLVAQEAERARVARDLHDELGQIITALRMEMDLSRKRLPVAPETAEAAFGGPIGLLELATAELRRICAGLRPPLLDDLGIVPALEQLIERFTKRTGIIASVDLQLADEDRVSNEVALTTYRIAQEALTNITRHADASEISVSLLYRAQTLVLSIYDNGVGFDERTLSASPGSGITGMQERARLVGGRLTMHAVLGEGTRVQLEAPLSQSSPAVEFAQTAT